MTYFVLALLCFVFALDAIGHENFMLAGVLGPLGGVFAACGLTGGTIWAV
jgi:hypothetical protein